MKLCVLLPAYNEGAVIGGLVRKISGRISDVIVVDDGSIDNTCREAEEAGAVVLKNSSNLGKGASLRKGFEYIVRENYDALITMDADGQHDCGEIPSFIRAAEETGADILLGTRMGSVGGMPFLRLLTNVVTSMIVSALCLQKITDSQTGYRMIRTGVLRNVKLQTSNYETESEILIKASRKGFRIREIPIKTIYGNQVSGIKPGKDTLRFIKLVLKSVF